MRWILCLLMLVVAVAYAADPKPAGCVCDPPSVKGCVQVTPGGPTPCDKKLDACLAWCMETPRIRGGVK